MDCEDVLQKSTHLNPTIFSLQNLRIFRSFFQTSTNKFDYSPIFRLLIHHMMHKHQLLHSSDAKVLPFYDYNVLKHNRVWIYPSTYSQSQAIIALIINISLTREVQILKLSKASVELFIFKDLQGPENGRSFNLHFQRYHLICSFFTDFQGPENGRSFNLHFQRYHLICSFFTDFQGPENGRSFNLHFQRYHLICSFFTDFQGPENGRSFNLHFQRYHLICSFFTDFQGPENGRSFNLHFQRYHLICSFFTDFQGPENGRSFHPKFQRPLLNYPIFRLSRPWKRQAISFKLSKTSVKLFIFKDITWYVHFSQIFKALKMADHLTYTFKDITWYVHFSQIFKALKMADRFTQNFRGLCWIIQFSDFQGLENGRPFHSNSQRPLLNYSFFTDFQRP